MRARLDQHGATVDDGVTVLTRRAILVRHFVIGHAAGRQNGADADVLAVAVGRTTLFDDIAAEARTIVHTEYAGNAADHATDGAANNGADRASRAATFIGAAFDAPRDALGLSERRDRHRGNDGGSSEKTADHDDLHLRLILRVTSAVPHKGSGRGTLAPLTRRDFFFPGYETFFTARRCG